MMYCNGRNIAWNVIAIAYCTMHETTTSVSVIGMIIVYNNYIEFPFYLIFMQWMLHSTG